MTSTRLYHSLASTGIPCSSKCANKSDRVTLPSTPELFPTESFLCRRICRRIEHAGSDAGLDGKIWDYGRDWSCEWTVIDDYQQTDENDENGYFRVAHGSIGPDCFGRPQVDDRWKVLQICAAVSQMFVPVGFSRSVRKGALLIRLECCIQL